MALPLDTRAQSIRLTTVAFASLFKDIPLIKYKDGVEFERVKVPITYSNKEKYVKRLDGDPGEIDKKVQITLPRIEYGLLNMQYDLTRKTNQANKIVGCGSTGAVYVNSPMPYNFNFELTLYTRNIEEANQILEYILPYFTPDYTIRINMVPLAGIVKNVPITLNGVTEDEDSTGIFDSAVRSVFRTFSFTARSFIFNSPLAYKPILDAITNLYITNPNNKFKLFSATSSANCVIGDTMFQGESFDRATAVGTVSGWDVKYKTVTLDIIKGAFVSNTIIQNISKSVIYTLQSIEGDGLVYKTDSKPLPNTYPVVGAFTANTTIITNY